MSVKSHLESLGLSRADVADLDIQLGFSRIKSVYFKRALATHPDKGGDAVAFRAVQEAWEVLRALYDEGRVSSSGWASYFDAEGPRVPVTSGRAASRAVPSWDWFAQAAQEPVPVYMVELARSDRSKCKAAPNKCSDSSPLIPKGTIRCGSLDLESGGYGRWFHLPCWRVPAVVWSGLPDPATSSPADIEAALFEMQSVTMCGFAALSAADKAIFVAHVSDKRHWARRAGKAAAAAAAASAAFAAASEPTVDPPTAKWPLPPSTAIVASSSGSQLAGARFELPRPGVNGALPNALQGQTFVLTGVFPEVGGGAGLDLGKARVRAAIESFGGRVTGSVSGKTTYVVVGKAPGGTKVAAARSKGIQMVDVAGLKQTLEGGLRPGGSLADAPDVVITSFSSGYRGNGLGMLADAPPPPMRAAVPAIRAAPQHRATTAVAVAAARPEPAPTARRAAASTRAPRRKAASREAETAAAEAAVDAAFHVLAVPIAAAAAAPDHPAPTRARKPARKPVQRKRRRYTEDDDDDNDDDNDDDSDYR